MCCIMQFLFGIYINSLLNFKMKSLKFAPNLAELILAGSKTTTWRLFDDKDLQTGDELVFINKETGDEFGTAKITCVSLRTLGTLTDEDWIGHEKFSSDEEMYGQYKKYYPNEIVDQDTVVKIINFDFTAKQ